MKLKGAMALALLAISAVAVTPAHAAATRAEYIAQADPICAQAYAEAQPLWARSAVDQAKGRYKKAARELLSSTAVTEGMVLNLAALQPPAEDVPLIDSWLKAQRDVNSLSRQQATALKHRKAKRAKNLGARVISAAEAARVVVANYGFAYCNQV
jgi:putative hemolysin